MYQFHLQPEWDKVKDCAEAQEFVQWEIEIDAEEVTEEEAEERLLELYHILKMEEKRGI